MRHARTWSRFDRIATPSLAVTLAVVLGACGGGTAAQVVPSMTDLVDAGSPGTATDATPEASLPPALLAASFTSPVYGYTLVLPDDARAASPQPATAAWDGVATVNSDGPVVDRYPRSDNRLFFVFEGPTDLDAEAWQAAIHERAVADHGCSAPRLQLNLHIDGAPGFLWASMCQGLVLLEATAVHEGTGLVAKQLMPPPPDDTVDEAFVADFALLVAGIDWIK